MGKAKLVVTKETNTGRNVEFQDTRNNRIMSDRESKYKIFYFLLFLSTICLFLTFSLLLSFCYFL